MVRIQGSPSDEKHMMGRLPGKIAAGACLLLGLSAPLHAMAEGELVQVHEDFSEDPGWEGFNNRISAQDGPLVKQDFGWMADSPIPGTKGAIGGMIWSSTTPAWYALPFGRPFSFNDRLSASGQIAFDRKDLRGSAYIGFFNHNRQEWRPWSSLAIRLSMADNNITMGIDYMSSQWGGQGYETDINIPADGSAHAWRLEYDPDAVPPEQWPDAKLKTYLSGSRQTAEQILEKARQDDPTVTLEQINQRLSASLAEGMVALFRRDHAYWTLLDHYDMLKGAVSLQVDDGQAYRFFVDAAHRGQPADFDRFGVFNFQLYSVGFSLSMADLNVNGQRIDLSKDPGWQGYFNRVQFVEQDFQRQDFGFSETNWAGEGIGEIGGTFYRVETDDPGFGYYADNVGTLTLEDPIHCEGNICFPRGGTDGAMFFGFFNAEAQKVKLTDPRKRDGFPLDDMLGITVEGPTRVGYYFSAICSPTRPTFSRQQGPIYLPTGEPTHFSFDYNPSANDGTGMITATLADQTFTLNLTPQQRQQGATFDHFGLSAIRKGGKYVTVYLDDLTYTARRGADWKPVRFEQQETVVPYPPGGRAY